MSETIAIFQGIFAEQAAYEEELRFRNPSFSFWYNWLVRSLVLALFVSFALWGIDSWANYKAKDMTNKAFAAWEAEQTVQDESAAESQEYVIGLESDAVAKAFMGIQLFIEKYHYSEADLATYARCMFNRADRESDSKSADPTDSSNLIRVISAPNQFTGYSSTNQVLADYKDLAEKLVREWHSETVKPCDTAYIFAELTPEGIFLKKDLHASPYDRRWHA